jgi:hypothetical protein
MKSVCTVSECDKIEQSRGLCPKHYYRLRRHGSVDAPGRRIFGSAEERFTNWYAALPNGCWLWTGRVTPKGYAHFQGDAARKVVAAHRWSYEHFKGPIPEGMQVDHTCHNADPTCKGGPTCLHRRCVNPDHLEAVDNTTNFSRSKNHHVNRTHCPKGHPYDEANTIVKPGRRLCRACRDATNRYYSDLRAARNRAARSN